MYPGLNISQWQGIFR